MTSYVIWADVGPTRYRQNETKGANEKPSWNHVTSSQLAPSSLFIYLFKQNGELLDALVRIRSHLILSNKCCRDFVVTPGMLKGFVAKQVYDASSSMSDINQEDAEEMLK